MDGGKYPLGGKCSRKRTGPPATALPGLTLPEERQRAVQTVRRPASQEQPEHPGKGEPALREARNPLDVRTEAPGTAPALAAERRTGGREKGEYALKRSNNPDVLYGRDFDDDFIEIEQIDGEMGR